MIIYFTSNWKIWLLSVLIFFFIAVLPAGGAAEISKKIKWSFILLQIQKFDC